MNITFLGGTETVTGSKFLVETGQTRVLVDCGLFQGYKWLRKRNRQPLPLDIASLDAVLLTHGSQGRFNPGMPIQNGPTRIECQRLNACNAHRCLPVISAADSFTRPPELQSTVS